MIISQGLFLPCLEIKSILNIKCINFITGLYVFVIDAQTAGWTEIGWCVLYILFSCLLIQGIRDEMRGMFLPWLIQTGVAVAFIIVFSIWLLYSYYIMVIHKVHT